MLGAAVCPDRPSCWGGVSVAAPAVQCGILAGSLYLHLLHSNLQDHVHIGLSPWQCLAPTLASPHCGDTRLPWTQGVNQSSTTFSSAEAPWVQPNSTTAKLCRASDTQFSETSNNKPKSKHIQNFFYIWVTMKTVARQPRYSSCPSRRDVNKSFHPVQYQVGDQYGSLTSQLAIDLIPMIAHQNDQYIHSTQENLLSDNFFNFSIKDSCLLSFKIEEPLHQTQLLFYRKILQKAERFHVWSAADFECDTGTLTGHGSHICHTRKKDLLPTTLFPFPFYLKLRCSDFTVTYLLGQANAQSQLQQTWAVTHSCLPRVEQDFIPALSFSIHH